MIDYASEKEFCEYIVHAMEKQTMYNNTQTNKTLSFTDINGSKFTIDAESLFKQLKDQSITIFGCDLPTIAELIKQYHICGGLPNMSRETVRTLFKRMNPERK